MKVKYFCFGGLVFALEGEQLPAEVEGYAAQFLSVPRKPDVVVQVAVADTLPIPRGKLLYEDYTNRVLENSDRIFLCRRTDHRPEEPEYAVVTYEKQCPDRIQLYFRADRCSLRYDGILSTIMIESLLLRHKRGIFHASWVDDQGAAVLFSGSSGAGKSTQAALWRSCCGAETLNGDKVLLWQGQAWGLPFAGTSGICKNRTQPIRAVVMLRHGSENSLRKLRGTEAVKAVLQQFPIQKWNPADIESAMDLAVQLVSEVPVYEYSCLPDASAVTYLKQKL